MINSALLYHYKEVSEQVKNPDLILGIFVYGSQNYGLSTAKSDTDTKTLILPTRKDIVFGYPCVSKEHILSNGEHTNLCDVRKFVRYLQKMSPNFHEILWTEYFILNPKYEDLFNQFRQQRESFARYDENKFFAVIINIAKKRVKKILKEEKTPERLLKELINLLRYNSVLIKYLHGCSFKNCLTLSEEERDWLLSLSLSPDEIKKLATQTFEYMKSLPLPQPSSSENKAYCDSIYFEFLKQICNISLKEGF